MCSSVSETPPSGVAGEEADPDPRMMVEDEEEEEMTAFLSDDGEKVDREEEDEDEEEEEMVMMEVVVVPASAENSMSSSSFPTAAPMPERPRQSGFPPLEPLDLNLDEDVGDVGDDFQRHHHHHRDDEAEEEEDEEDKENSAATRSPSSPYSSGAPGEGRGEGAEEDRGSVACFSQRGGAPPPPPSALMLRRALGQQDAGVPVSSAPVSRSLSKQFFSQQQRQEQRLSDRQRSWSTSELRFPSTVTTTTAAATGRVPTPVGFDDTLRAKPRHKWEPLARPDSPLPLVVGDVEGLPSIAPGTLADLLSTDKYTGMCDRVVVVDCRYPYEFSGGHVVGAVNLTYPNVDEAIRRKFFNCSSQESLMRAASRTVLVFHCEFSQNRGPRTMRRLKEVESRSGGLSGQLGEPTYKHVYLLSGGYCQFFAEFPHLCEPRGYVPMLHERFSAELTKYKALSTKEHQLREQGFHAKATAAAAAATNTPPPPLVTPDDATVTVRKLAASSQSLLRRPLRGRSQSFSELLNACAMMPSSTTPPPVPPLTAPGASRMHVVPSALSPVVKARPVPASCTNSPERSPSGAVLPPLHRTRTMTSSTGISAVRSPSPLSSPRQGACQSPLRRREILQHLHAVSSACSPVATSPRGKASAPQGSSSPPTSSTMSRGSSSPSVSSSRGSTPCNSAMSTPVSSPMRPIACVSSSTCLNASSHHHHHHHTAGPSPLSSPVLLGSLAFVNQPPPSQTASASSVSAVQSPLRGPPLLHSHHFLHQRSQSMHSSGDGHHSHPPLPPSFS